MSNLVLSDIERSLMAEFVDDYVGLWSVIRDVADASPVGASEMIKDDTLRLIKRLLIFGLIEAGFPSRDGRKFVPWKLPIGDTIQRIRSEWSALGRTPNIGEIV